MMKLLTVYYFAEASPEIFERVLNTPLTSRNVYFHFVYALKTELYHVLLEVKSKISGKSRDFLFGFF